MQNDRDDLEHGRDTIGLTGTDIEQITTLPTQEGLYSTRVRRLAPRPRRRPDLARRPRVLDLRSDPEHDQPRRAQALKDAGGDPWEGTTAALHPRMARAYRDRFPRRDATARHHPARAVAAPAGRARRTTATEALKGPVARRLGGFMLLALPVVLLAGAGNPPCSTPGTVNTPAGGGPVAAGMYAQPLRLQPGRWYQVGATSTAGRADPTSGDYGSIGTPGQSYLPAHPDTFAELSVLDHNPANGGSVHVRRRERARPTCPT